MLLNVCLVIFMFYLSYAKGYTDSPYTGILGSKFLAV